MKKICVVTGSRADYGLLRWLMQGIKDARDLELQLAVTGQHLSPEFGLTYREIEGDGFLINCKIESLLSADTPSAVTKSFGLGVIGFADAFARLSPDLIILLGDRYEIFSAACAALIGSIPIGHIHGGELTEGAYDDSIRHSITKMASLHFVATKEYGLRVKQLGEESKRIFQVGGLGIDNILKIPLMTRKSIEDDLGVRFSKRNFLVTYHPTTLNVGKARVQTEELLKALGSLDNTTIVFTMPNADNEGRIISHLIENFVETHKNAKYFKSLGQRRYLSLLSQVDAVIGNSSSGLIEAPSFKKATINIGDRQNGRVKSSSVIDCSPLESEILSAIEMAFSPDFKMNLSNVVNPYGLGGSSQKIVEILNKENISHEMLKKVFYNIPMSI
jgi:GDP/UDP-N,N'-diacetylbacillosamine 2-epimerase (hydrolysing)